MACGLWLVSIGKFLCVWAVGCGLPCIGEFLFVEVFGNVHIDDDFVRCTVYGWLLFVDFDVSSVFFASPFSAI